MGEAYNAFVSGKVKRLVSFKAGKRGEGIVVLAATVEASQTLTKAYQPWCVVKDDGPVTCAHCTCMAGCQSNGHILGCTCLLLLGRLKRLTASAAGAWGTPKDVQRDENGLQFHYTAFVDDTVALGAVGSASDARVARTDARRWSRLASGGRSVLVFCLFAYVACGVVVQNVHVPQPYSFGYDNVDEFGTRLTRQETGDELNNKVGSYGYVDAHGVARTVNYVADALGFRATVETNEPGTKTSAPADAPTYSSSVEVLVCCLFAYVACGVVVENVHVPQPYNFGYDNVDEFGTRMTRQETGDALNNKVGSYSYVDAHGVARTVNYVADALGFRATVETNEPGTKTSVLVCCLFAYVACGVVVEN
ncbi:hypothetical protein HPB47_025100, partial [Ixodes persulcatus]